MRRKYMLTDRDELELTEQVDHLKWPDGDPVVLGDFGQRLMISGLLFQGEGYEVLLLGSNASESKFIRETTTGKQPVGNMLGDVIQIEGAVQPDLLSWCRVILQTDDPVFFEQNEEGLIKAVHRKVMHQISAGVQWEIFERDSFQCMYCGRKGGKGNPLTIDHFFPLSRGGADRASNYLTCCKYHAKLKGDRSPDEFCTAENLDYRGLELYLAGKAPLSFIAHLS